MSARKMMATVFWDRKGVILVDFLERGIALKGIAKLSKNSEEQFKTSAEECCALRSC